VFQDAWVDFLVHFFQAGFFLNTQLRAKQKAGETLSVEDYMV
jgi:hypothetical protein